MSRCPSATALALACAALLAAQLYVARMSAAETEAALQLQQRLKHAQAEQLCVHSSCMMMTMQLHYFASKTK